MDGLGDRSRSLSPERDGADGAWDTLLTTLTPDPQPPSAASSFATNSAGDSAVSGVNSANTSMTSVDNDAANPHVCEYETEGQSPFYESDLEDELDEEMAGSFQPRRFWRSYANFASVRADRYPSIDSPTGLTGMQRIVRRLASRQDIPDEWWAEAGLSRNFTTTVPETST